MSLPREMSFTKCLKHGVQHPQGADCPACKAEKPKKDDMSEQAAFPGVVELPAGARPGMSLRDYFAAKAMAALIALDRNDTYSGDIAKAYELADLMLKERSK